MQGFGVWDAHAVHVMNKFLSCYFEHSSWFLVGFQGWRVDSGYFNIVRQRLCMIRFMEWPSRFD